MINKINRAMLNANLKPNICWSFVVSSANYVIGARRLYERLLYYKTKYPVEILVTDNISNVDLSPLVDNNIPYRVIPFIKLLNAEDDRQKLTINKIAAYTLTDYTFVCCLDVDIIPYANLDYLIDTVIPEFSKSLYNFNSLCCFNTGKWSISTSTFFVKPNLDEYNKIIDFSKHCLEEETDESLLGKYFLTNSIKLTDLIPFCIIDSTDHNPSYTSTLNKKLIQDSIHCIGPLKFWDPICITTYSLFNRASAEEYNYQVSKWKKKLQFISRTVGVFYILGYDLEHSIDSNSNLSYLNVPEKGFENTYDSR